MSTYSSNLIPIMTNNTSPSGIASSSNVAGTTYQPSNAFDQNLSTYFREENYKGWLQYKFSTPQIVNKYSITIVNTNFIKDFTFQGSIDGTSWNILDTHIDDTGWVSGSPKSFEFNNTTSYSYYRLNVTATTNSGWRMMIHELSMYQKILTPKYLIKQNSNYYTMQTTNYDSVTMHSFIPLTLTGGVSPNKADIDTFGFEDLNLLTNSMTVNTDIFIPVSKFDNNAELKLYKG